MAFALQTPFMLVIKKIVLLFMLNRCTLSLAVMIIMIIFPPQKHWLKEAKLGIFSSPCQQADYNFEEYLCLTLSSWQVRFFLSAKLLFSVSGGFDHTPDRLEDLLMFDPMTFDWKKIGAMKTRRYKHGASLVNIKDVLNYCET